ncbi:MAG TPA: alpha/beta fold hydrolase, partial [Gaiellales bacterium]|nr:alpha/beta fold hydrolase [Gaiellales bacterium]
MWIDPSGADAVLVLAHGAGSGMRTPFMAGFAEEIGRLGVATLRFEFPYMRAGRRAPDRPPVLLDAWREAFAEGVSGAKGRPVFAGGKSMGGRIASMAAAEGMPAAGLVFVGYPLHPPGRPEKIR